MSSQNAGYSRTYIEEEIRRNLLEHAAEEGGYYSVEEAADYFRDVGGIDVVYC